jgi:hypothetical protein
MKPPMNAETMTTRNKKFYYIKERDNGQTQVYFTPMGKLSKTQAARHDNPLSGSNVMHGFNSEKEYEDKISELKAQGARFM